MKSFFLTLVAGLFFATPAHARSGMTFIWTGAADSSWSNPGNWDQSAVPLPIDDVVFSGIPANDCDLDANAAVVSVHLDNTFFGVVTIDPGVSFGTANFTQDGGSFYCGDMDFTVSGDLNLNAGGFRASSSITYVSNNFTVGGGSFDHNFGELLFNGGSDQFIASNGALFNHVDIDSSATVHLQDDLHLAGDWVQDAGSFDPGSYTVHFDGSSQGIYGPANFYGLDHTLQAPASLFLSGGAISVSGPLVLRGSSPGALLGLSSDVSGVQNDLDAEGSEDLDYLQIQDINAVKGLSPVNSVDLGDNTNINFGAAPTDTETPSQLPTDTDTPTETPTETPTVTPTAGPCDLSTYGGGGSYPGEGQPATDAAFGYTNGLGFNSSGDLLLDAGNGQIRRIDRGSGDIFTLVGDRTVAHAGDGGPGVAASTFGASGHIAADASGNFYWAEEDGDTIREWLAASGNVTTVAGTGVQGYSGDGGPALSANLDGPTGIVIDSHGDLIWTEYGNQVVRKMDIGTHVISTLAGDGSYGSADGPALSASFGSLEGLAIDPGNDDLYVTDAGNALIRKVDGATHAVTTIAGNGVNAVVDAVGTNASFYYPIGPILDSAGHLYVAELTQGVIRRVDLQSLQVITLSGKAGVSAFGGDSEPYGGSNAAYDGPAALEWDPATGDLFISDRNNLRVRRILGCFPPGTPTPVVTPTPTATPAACDLSTYAGPGSFTAGLPAPGNAGQTGALGFDGAGNLLFDDDQGYRVLKVDRVTGLESVFAGDNSGLGDGGDGGPAPLAQTTGAWGNLAHDGAGNVYYCEGDNGTIRKVDSLGNITTVAGTGPGTSTGTGGPALAAGLDLPYGVAIGADNKLYWIEQGAMVVRRMDLGTHLVEAVAGLAYNSGTANGTGAAARFTHLMGIVFGSDGFLYVSDDNNEDIRRIDTVSLAVTRLCAVNDTNPLAADNAGYLYNADGAADVLQRIRLSDGAVTDIAGSSFNAGFAGDGGPAGSAAARFDMPSAVAWDANSGDLFIADYNNGRIRRILACYLPATPTPVLTATRTPSPTPSATMTATLTRTPSASPTASPTVSITALPTNTPVHNDNACFYASYGVCGTHYNGRGLALMGGFEYETGYHDAGGGNDSVSLAKWDDLGDLYFGQVYPNGRHEQASAIAADPANNALYVAGRVDTGVPRQSFLTMKFDANGNSLWAQTYNDGSLEDIAGGVAVDHAHNVLVAGYSYNQSFSNNYNLLVVKYDPAGNPLWTRSFGSGNESGGAVAVDSADNVYVGGSSAGQFLVVKYDSAGSFQWSKTVVDANGGGGVAGLAVDGSDNLYMTGTFDSGGGNNQWETVKLDPSGTVLWDVPWTGPNNSNYANAIAVGADGGVYVGGSRWGIAAWAIKKYDTQGNEQWFGYPSNGGGNSSASGIAVDNAVPANIYMSGDAGQCSYIRNQMLRLSFSCPAPATASPTQTATATASATPTGTPSITLSRTPTPTPTQTSTAANTATALPSATFTAVPGAAYANILSHWITNGQVYAVTSTASTIYLGGTFTQIGPRSGGGVPFDATTGSPIAGFPEVAGNVDSVVGDGNGGWFISGVFNQVAGVTRHNLAHVLANGSLDPSWDPNANGTVYKVLLSGSTVYAAGSFTTINGATARNGLAALDASTGLASAWDPNVTGLPTALAVSGSRVLIGGTFSAVNGGLPRNNLASVDATTGVADAWNPNVNGLVSAVTVNGTALYLAGSFTAVNGATVRNRLAAVDLATGLATSWDPNASGPVSALAISGSLAYVTGNFNALNGGTVRNYFAAIDTSTGLVNGWNPNADQQGGALVLNGSLAYVGGSFTSFNGGLASREHLAALDTSSGLPTAWDPKTNNSVICVAVSGTTVYAGGTFSSVGLQTVRLHAAALDASTGLPSAWDPSINGNVYSLALAGGLVYAGGSFSLVNGVTARNNLAALDASSGAATAWDPNVNGQVLSISLGSGGGVAYVGGAFSQVNGSATRNNLAGLNTATGLASSWNPNASAQVNAVAVGGGAIYVGGNFSLINGGTARNHLAAVDFATGLVSAWNPNVVGTGVQCIALGPATAYVGGTFGTVNSITRNNLAEVDLTTGLPTAWNPNLNSSVRTVAPGAGVVYVGGQFLTVNGGTARSNLVELDAGTGVASPWDPEPSSAVNALDLDPAQDRLYVGGLFKAFEGRSSDGYAAVILNPPTPTQTPTATPTGSPSATGTASATPSATCTATPSATGSATPSATCTATPSATGSVTSSATATATPSCTATPSVSASATLSATPSMTASATLSATPSLTASPTPSVTLSATASATATPSATSSASPTPSETVTAPMSPTFSPTRTPSPTLTATLTVSDTATPTQVLTATATFTISETPSITDTPLPTATAVIPVVLDRNVFRPELGQPLAIAFKPPEDGRVRVRIFNVAGENVRVPFEADVASGAWIQAHWDGTNENGEKCAAGVYVISIKGAGIRSLKKVVLLK